MVETSGFLLKKIVILFLFLFLQLTTSTIVAGKYIFHLTEEEEAQLWTRAFLHSMWKQPEIQSISQELKKINRKSDPHRYWALQRKRRALICHYNLLKRYRETPLPVFSSSSRWEREDFLQLRKWLSALEVRRRHKAQAMISSPREFAHSDELGFLAHHMGEESGIAVVETTGVDAHQQLVPLCHVESCGSVRGADRGFPGHGAHVIGTILHHTRGHGHPVAVDWYDFQLGKYKALQVVNASCYLPRRYTIKLIEKIEGRPLLLVQAAGNDHSQMSTKDNLRYLVEERRFPHVIMALNIAQNNTLSPTTNFPGPDTRYADLSIATLGMDVLSHSHDCGFEEMSGTSMATPTITAVARLLLLQDPSLSPLQLRDIILLSARQSFFQGNFEDGYKGVFMDRSPSTTPLSWPSKYRVSFIRFNSEQFGRGILDAERASILLSLWSNRGQGEISSLLSELNIIMDFQSQHAARVLQRAYRGYKYRISRDFSFDHPELLPESQGMKLRTLSLIRYLVRENFDRATALIHHAYFSHDLMADIEYHVAQFARGKGRQTRIQKFLRKMRAKHWI